MMRRPISAGFLPGSAIVRDLPKSFFQCLKQEAPSTPIDVSLAQSQHRAYVRALKTVIRDVVELPADERYPDCCFIEDTAVIVGQRAAITWMGAESRRGEELAVRETLQSRGIETVDIQAPAKIDGGDVLFTGQHLVVGLSRRTNEAGARALAGVFEGVAEVLTVPVEGSLHLKSVLSGFDEETLIFGDCDAGRRIWKELDSLYNLSKHYRVEWVPDPASSNVLSLGEALIIQDDFPKSAEILEKLAAQKGSKIIPLTMSELIKADGALTCCSLLY